jgi:glycine betaine/proline transport system permease protein
MATESTDALISRFAGPGAAYYTRQFARLGQAPGWRASFNAAVALVGPAWFAARGLWGWFLAFLLLEGFALVQILIGVFGDRGREQRERAESILRTLASRRQQIEEAITSNSPSLDALRRAAASLEGAYADALRQADAASQSGLTLVVLGLVMLLACRVLQAVVANSALERDLNRGRWLDRFALCAT